MAVQRTRNKTPYERWLETEGLEVLGGNTVSDIASVPLKWWDHMGAFTARVSFDLCRQFVDAYIAEIPARSQSKPERHLFEEVILILSGRGATRVWIEPEHKQTFEWQEGGLFAVPLNAWHQHFNLGEQAVRFLAVTTAPSMINAFHNLDFIFNNEFAFTDRFRGEDEYFSPQGREWVTPEGVSKVWEANFIPDIFRLRLADFSVRGAGGTNAFLQFAENALVAHVSEFPVGTYKKGHRHPQVPGFLGITLSGQGYSLVWDGSVHWSRAVHRDRIEWRRNTLWTYDGNLWHQHFNIGREPARYVAFYLGSRKYPGFGGWLDRWTSYASLREGGFNIDYEDEDPAIFEMFRAALAEAGVTMKDPSQWRH